jgi:SAM-dependent methyltransferase
MHNKDSSAESVTQSVLEFYSHLAFNQTEMISDLVDEVRRTDPLDLYPCLRGLIKNKVRVLEIGCGVGWFSNSLNLRHKAQVTGVDINPVAIERALLTASSLGTTNQFVVSDLFGYAPESKFPFVVSLGVLHHTYDCHAAIKRVCSEFVETGGHFLLGLYHEHGRRPFLDHFRLMSESGASNELLLSEFRRLRGSSIDSTHLESWFRDQVLHPHETQHTYAEVRALLKSQDFEVISTSINKFQPITSHEALEAKELEFASVSKQALADGRYFPGFFVVLARRNT